MSEISRRNPFLAPFPLPSRVDLENTADKIRLKLLASGISSDSRSARSQFQGHHIWLNLVLFCSHTMLHISLHEGSQIALRFQTNKFLVQKHPFNDLLSALYSFFDFAG